MTSPPAGEDAGVATEGKLDCAVPSGATPARNRTVWRGVVWHMPVCECICGEQYRRVELPLLVLTQQLCAHMNSQTLPSMVDGPGGVPGSLLSWDRLQACRFEGFGSG